MNFDPEQHEKHQRLYLETLLAAVEEHEKDHPDDAGAIIGSYEAEMAKTTGLSRAVVSRISDELSALYLLECHGGLGPEFGRSYSLTAEGRLVAEKGRYERSPLAKRRKVKTWLKTKGAELAQVGAGKLLAWIGSMFLAALGILNAESIAKAIRHLLGY